MDEQCGYPQVELRADSKVQSRQVGWWVVKWSDQAALRMSTHNTLLRARLMRSISWFIVAECSSLSAMHVLPAEMPERCPKKKGPVGASTVPSPSGGNVRLI